MTTLQKAVHTKTYLNRDERVRDALLFTYKKFQDAVTFWFDLFVHMRQADVCLEGDVVKTGAEYREELRDWLKARNKAHDDATLDDLKMFYPYIVKSYAEAKKGVAADVSGLAGLLMQPGSKNAQLKYQAVFDFDWMIPLCKPLMTADEQKAHRAAVKKARKDGTNPPPKPLRVPLSVRSQLQAQITADPDTLKSGGNTAGWARAYKREMLAGTPLTVHHWPELLLVEVETKRVDVAGPISAMERLKARGVFPISPFRFNFGVTAMSRWDRAALHVVGSRLNPWESWQHEMTAAVEKLDKRLAEAHTDLPNWVTPDGDPIALLRAWEQAMNEKNQKRGYEIQRKTIRGWAGHLRLWLRKNPGATAEERQKWVTTLHRRKPREVGSIELLLWLAEPERQWIAEHPKGDPVSWYAQFNRTQWERAKKRLMPRLTLVDEDLLLDCPPNQNSPQFQIMQDMKGQLAVCLPLIEPDNGDTVKAYTDPEPTLRIVPSGQLREPRLTLQNGYSVISVDDQDGRGRTAYQVAGSRLRVIDNGPEKYPTVRFAITLKSIVPDALDARTDILWWIVKRAPHEIDRLQRGLAALGRTSVRIMAVNPGLNNSLGCAIYRIVFDPEDGSILKFEHERSFPLNLPGERPDNDELALRNDLMQEARFARGLVNKLRAVAGLVKNQGGGGVERLQAALDDMLGDRAPRIDLNDLQASYRELEAITGQAIADVVARPAIGGKSFWHLKYLSTIHNLLVAWTKHVQPGVEAKQRKGFGDVSKKILAHKTALHEDRSKTIADMCIQTARGLMYDAPRKRWVHRYAEVDIILVDDLSRYRFKDSRHASENSRLMEWCQRKINECLKQQALQAGIVVHEEPCVYTSQYCASSGMPGIRCHPLKASEVGGLAAGDKNWLYRAAVSAGYSSQQIAALRTGDLVPVESGEVLVTPQQQVHVDLTEPQNLVRRLVERHPPIRTRAWEEKGSGGTVLGRKRPRTVRFERVRDGVYTRSKKRLGELETARTDDADLAEFTGAYHILLRDPSGTFFDTEHWIDSTLFWATVRERVVAKLSARASGVVVAKRRGALAGV